ncbi:MAG: glucose-1-phosphate adenylyltransferase [Candidatus Hydrogenedentes bacterium]|nr:glucose-1-phosphate adenylyltransferase [Candidatus Hydrogenedentota bacterium]
MLKAHYELHRLTRRTMGIVLGGGRGTRLYPLTKYRAKPAVPLCGRYRLVDIPLSNCINSGIMRIVVLTQFNSHSLNRHIMNTYHFDEFHRGSVTILAAEQTNETGDWFQGTADAVRKHLLHIYDPEISFYLILSGDQLYRMEYKELLNTHIAKNADITVSAIPVAREHAHQFGIMQVDSNGKITQFVEKPKSDEILEQLTTPSSLFEEFGINGEGKPYLASMGVYVFNAEVLIKLLREHLEWIDFGKQLIPGALKEHKVYAHMFDGFWEDIGTVRSYYEVSIAMTTDAPPFEFHDPDQPIYTHRRALPGAKISNAEIDHAIICSGVKIAQSKISNSIIGIRSVIRPNAIIKESILCGADSFEIEPTRHPSGIPMGIGEGSYIEKAIIDHNARIGKNVIIIGSNDLSNADGDGFSIRDGIVVIHKNAIISNNTKIGKV